ncbi:hypothetical protein JB92DRAFT_3050203 [Gautieria morchelliformis]|nr:hypothetical protein JB92DRAFT_3050203 [Gautieria morchelliformis]
MTFPSSSRYSGGPHSTKNPTTYAAQTTMSPSATDTTAYDALHSFYGSSEGLHSPQSWQIRTSQETAAGPQFEYTLPYHSDNGGQQGWQNRAAVAAGSTSSTVDCRAEAYAVGRQPEGLYGPLPAHGDPAQPSDLPLSGTGFEYLQQFGQQDFPQSGYTDGTWPYCGGQQSLTTSMTPPSCITNAELGANSCHTGPCGQTDEISSSYSAMEYFSGEETADFALPQEDNWPYNDNGAGPSRSLCYDSGGKLYTDGGESMPTIKSQHFYYDQRVAWTATATPPAANVAGLETVGSLAMQPGPGPSGCSFSVWQSRPVMYPSKPVRCPRGCKRGGQPRTYSESTDLRRHLRNTCSGPRDEQTINALVAKAFPGKRKWSRRK